MRKFSHNLMIIVLCVLISTIILPKNTLAVNVPSSPTNLIATSAGSSQINLTWDSSLSGATSYYLYRSTAYYGTYSNIAVLTSPSYADTGLTGNSTYYYKVQSVNSAGSSGYSAIANATTTSSYSVPTSPTNLIATVAGPSQINLTWDAISGATNYYLYRSTSYYGTYSNIAVLTSPSYSNTGLATNGTYYYKVEAYNSAGASGFSAITGATLTSNAYGVPTIPTNLIATATGSNQINLSWDYISGATSYYLYRATSYSGVYSYIAAPTSTSYVDSGLATNAIYYYEVQAVSSAGSSGYSAIASATTTTNAYGVPTIPTNLIATATGSNQINLSWDYISGATSYYLYRATSYSGVYSYIAAPTSTSYVDSGLATNAIYYYKVQAVSSAGSSGYSAIASATTTTNVYGVPTIPTNLIATATGSNQVNLSWDYISGATSYYLYRATSYSGVYSYIAAPTSTSYVDSGLATNAIYYYKVQAVSSAGSSGYSAIASATTTTNAYGVPTIPTNLIVTATGSNQVNLSWDYISGATSYYLYRATSYSGVYSYIAAPTSTSYVDSGLATNATYYYKVQAVSSAGSSGYSAIASATTTTTSDGVPSAPTNLAATAAGSSQINLTWDAISGATSYYLYRATSSDGTYANIVAVTTTGYVDTGLSAGTTYYYEVQAINNVGSSSYSSVVYATTDSNVTTSPPDSSSQIQSTRLAGQDRYETAADISKSWWNTSYYVVIASGDSFADALCGAPLATKYNAPILLSPKDSLDEQTKNQLASLSAKKVFIIGGVGVISSNVEQAIKNMGIDVTRIAGSDRYETSLKVAQTIGNFNQAVIATGEDFPDALSIAPIAAIKGMPIILTPKDNLSTALKDYLNKTAQSTYVLGGVGVVSDNVFKQLPDPTRLSGADRYETNLNIIKEFSNELDFENCYLATGEDFPDALAGSALAALTTSPIILVSNPVQQSAIDFINSKTGSIKKIIIFGGTNAVPESILESIEPTNDGSSVPSIPLTPTGITATTGSSSQIGLTWDSVSGATSYNVYAATSSSGTYTNIATVTTPSYTNTGLWAGTTYYYKVQAVNSAGTSPYSAITYATTTAS